MNPLRFISLLAASLLVYSCDDPPQHQRYVPTETFTWIVSKDTIATLSLPTGFSVSDTMLAGCRSSLIRFPSGYRLYLALNVPDTQSLQDSTALLSNRVDTVRPPWDPKPISYFVTGGRKSDTSLRWRECRIQYRSLPSIRLLFDGYRRSDLDECYDVQYSVEPQVPHRITSQFLRASTYAPTRSDVVGHYLYYGEDTWDYIRVSPELDVMLFSGHRESSAVDSISLGKYKIEKDKFLPLAPPSLPEPSPALDELTRQPKADSTDYWARFTFVTVSNKKYLVPIAYRRSFASICILTGGEPEVQMRTGAIYDAYRKQHSAFNPDTLHMRRAR